MYTTVFHIVNTEGWGAVRRKGATSDGRVDPQCTAVGALSERQDPGQFPRIKAPAEAGSTSLRQAQSEAAAVAKMRSFRIPERELNFLKEIAARKHENNQTQALLEAINRYHQELHPPSLQGYVRIDRLKETDATGDRSGCRHADASGAWVAVYSNGTVKGVLCDKCVNEGRT